MNLFLDVKSRQEGAKKNKERQKSRGKTIWYYIGTQTHMHLLPVVVVVVVVKVAQKYD